MADRVFGWVSKDGGGGFRGRAAVGPVTVVDAQVEWSRCTLAILSTPRPSYGRFYVGKDGKPWPNGGTKEERGYDAAHATLRGRKVYPHQIDPGYQGQYAASKTTGEQNRTMAGCITSGTFEFELRFEGLTSVEEIGRASCRERV